MPILAFDASTELCTVALHSGVLRHERVEHAGQRHSEMLLPMIDAMLAKGGVRLDQLDGIAFGAGPGSFTGLRIACGIAQGLALGSGVPLLGVSTLEAIAEAAWQRDGARRVIASLDARMHEVYVAAYERDGDAWRVCMEPAVAKPSEIALPPGDGWIGAGNGFSEYPALRERLSERLAHGAIATDIAPSAGAIATLAIPRIASGLGVAPAHAAPFYVRHRVALTTAERNAGIRQ
jgi:tRNA threonylcarbamoyladenosine biosynthesis protein TsaB